jgi:hypothetical protein
LVRGCEIDLADLPTAERQQLSELLASIDQQPLPKPKAAARDSMQYELWIETADGTKELSLGGSQVTPALHPLLRILGSRARPVKP